MLSRAESACRTTTFDKRRLSDVVQDEERKKINVYLMQHPLRHRHIQRERWNIDREQFAARSFHHIGAHHDALRGL